MVGKLLICLGQTLKPEAEDLMTDFYAVIGNPISHSKSPMIHHAFAELTRQDIQYERVMAPLDGFAETVGSLLVPVALQKVYCILFWLHSQPC
jgi:hypothetical protein